MATVNASDRREDQLRHLRFLETLQDTMYGCGSESDMYGSVVHRIASAFGVRAVGLATYEPVSGRLEMVHQAGERYEWDLPLLRQAVESRRSALSQTALALPIVGDTPHGDAVPWGVLALVRSVPAEAGSPFTPAERQTFRLAASRVAAELERRRVLLLDDVLDGLLRKAKPIDVYNHALRELRRFIRYDHSASVMTMQRGLAQITIRTEKLVGLRGQRETLLDSSRRGRVVRLTAAQQRYLSRLDGAIEMRKDGEGYHLVGGHADPDANGLWRVLCVNESCDEGSILCYPLTFGGQMLGILRVAARRPGVFDPLDRNALVLERFARLLAVTLYRSELYHQSDRQLQAIKQISRAITEPIPVEEVCQQVLGLALRVLHCQVGSIGLLQPDGKLALAAHQGCSLEEVPILSIGEGIAGDVVRTGQSRAVPDVLRESNYVVFNSRVRSELVAPITYNREVLGFLDVESFEEGRFREEDEEVTTFLEALANQAAIAIKTAQLHFEAMERLGSTMTIDPDLSTAGLQDFLIEELRHNIEQLGAANERLASANRAKSDFLARMSHDLRGPLNVIVGLTNLLTDPSVGPSMTPEKQRESLEVIRSSGEVLSSLIGNILDLSALEAGKVEFNPVPVKVDAALNYLRSMADTQAQESMRQLEIAITAEPAITTIYVDEEKFLRILINLLSNAIKFTPSGGQVQLGLAVDDGPDAGALHVVVADTGIGIPADYHEQIFEPFRRIEGVGGGQHHGTGLGLAVVRQLAELHGGRVWVESSPGQGSAFHVVLPHALAVPVELDTETRPLVEAVPVTVAAATDGPERARTRGLILVVEDTEAHMNLMRLAVTSRGYAMHGVSSGEEAISWLAANRPDVILLDMQLPGMDGFSVAAHIKQQIEMHTIPLIAVTASALSGDEQRALASGCDAFLTKPIDIATLLKTIDAVTA